MKSSLRWVCAYVRMSINMCPAPYYRREGPAVSQDLYMCIYACVCRCVCLCMCECACVCV